MVMEKVSFAPTSPMYVPYVYLQCCTQAPKSAIGNLRPELRSRALQSEIVIVTPRVTVRW